MTTWGSKLQLVGAALCAVTLANVSAALADEAVGDVAEAEKVFKNGAVGHAVGTDAKAKPGPALNGIVGRPAASSEGYSYSEAPKSHGTEGLIRTAESNAKLIGKPKDFVPGTKMNFAGLRKEDKRADVIAYLATFAEQ